MAHIGNASNKALAITNAHVGNVNGKAMPLIKGWMGNANSKAVPIWSKETGWVWQKYAINEITESGYREVAGASESKSKRNSFYVGDSYTLSQTTGQFSVNHNTPIKIAAAGATAAVGKYYTDDFHTSAETTTDGTTLYLITAAKYSISGLKLTVTPYTAEAYSTTIQEKGDLLGTVTSADITAYPMNGIADDGYWYVLLNEILQLDISYSGTYTDEAVQMQNGAYRLLTLTGSGSLSIPQTVKADIWLCGGGLNGGGAGLHGGNGACTAAASEQTIQGLTVGIGAAAADSTISGDVSLTATKATASSSTGSGTGGGSGSLGNYSNSVIKGDGLSKLPFDDNYFPAPYCDGGGGGGYHDDVNSTRRQGGAGGTNGSDGGSRINGTILGGAGGGLYGGAGGTAGENAGNAATGYGSGGGGGGYEIYSDGSYSGAGGSGYQGVCFIRIPLEQ